MRLRCPIAAHLLQDHASRGLARTGRAAVLGEEMEGEVGGRLSSGTGDRVAVFEKDGAGVDGDVGEFGFEIRTRVPVNTAPPTLHDAGPGQHKGGRADADDGNTTIGDAAQVFERSWIGIPLRLHSTADDHEIVEFSRVWKRCPWRNFNTAVGADWLQSWRDHRPAAFLLPAVIGFITGYAQGVHETCEGKEGEFVQQNERHGYLRLRIELGR